MYSTKLNLNLFFYPVRSQEYVIVKLPHEFPNYYLGSDIDIFCIDKSGFINKILEVGNQYVENGFEIILNDKDDTHTQIDFIIDNILEFRFDLHSAIPNYNIRMNKYYYYSVIDRRDTFMIDHNKYNYPVFIPSEIDELIIRYLEYMEWYEKRPDKIKHLHYIQDKISDKKIKNSFFNRLHIYAAIPNVMRKNSRLSSYFMNQIFSLPLYYIKKIKSKGFVGTLQAVRNKFYNK